MEEFHPHTPEIHSFLVNRILNADIADFSKKRKLLDKQLSLPTRKLKFRDVSHGSEQSSLSTGEPEVEALPSPTTWMMNLSSNVLHDDVESTQPESEMDSNSFVEETDCALSQSTEVKSEPEVSKLCNHDKPVSSKREFPEVNACDKPSTSSGGCGSNNSKDRLYFLDNRSLKKVRVGEEEVEEEASHLGFGYHTDYICSEKAIGESEECMNLESEEEVVLYPSGASSDLFVLSSGRWKINQDAQAGARKPTIDQEFEQYFSMLML